jgi:hypothetical protein
LAFPVFILYHYISYMIFDQWGAHNFHWKSSTDYETNIWDIYPIDHILALDNKIVTGKLSVEYFESTMVSWPGHTLKYWTKIYMPRSLGVYIKARTARDQLSAGRGSVPWPCQAPSPEHRSKTSAGTEIGILYVCFSDVSVLEKPHKLKYWELYE